MKKDQKSSRLTDPQIAMAIRFPNPFTKLRSRTRRRRRSSGQTLNLPYQKALLIHELIIICSVVQKRG
jgi:hypothetical protein